MGKRAPAVSRGVFGHQDVADDARGSPDRLFKSIGLAAGAVPWALRDGAVGRRQLVALHLPSSLLRLPASPVL
jgi:hypothetical protein